MTADMVPPTPRRWPSWLPPHPATAWAWPSAFGCGLRVGEILGLRPRRREPVRRDHHAWSSNTSVEGLVAPKTWRGVRTIEMPELVVAKLHRRALRDGPPDGSADRGQGPEAGGMGRDGWYQQAWRPALAGAGLDPVRSSSTPAATTP